MKDVAEGVSKYRLVVRYSSLNWPPPWGSFHAGSNPLADPAADLGVDDKLDFRREWPGLASVW